MRDRVFLNRGLLQFIGGQDTLGFFLIVIKLFSIPFVVEHLRDRDYVIS